MSSTRSVPRLSWADLDDGLRRAVQAEIGSEVVQWESQEEGFSPGLAARCLLADGRRVFIKALSAELIELSGGFMAHEVAVNRALPGSAPAPKMIAAVDDLDHGHAVVFTDIEGRLPDNPWTEADVAAVVETLDRLVLPPVPELPSIVDHLADDFSGWRKLAARGETGIDDHLDQRVLDRLAQIEAGWVEHFNPEALIHSDVRADNLLIDVDGLVWIVDWANACNGPAWFDLIGMLPSMAMQGGPPPAEVWARSSYATSVDGAAVDAAAVCLSGYFTEAARRPIVPEIPMLRNFQEAQARPARAWMGQRLGLAGYSP